jgi:hypothetical protein
MPPGWQPWFTGKVARGHAWPWVLVRNIITKETLTKLNSDPFLGATEGIWVQERRFDLARRLLGRGSLSHGALPADEVRDQAAKLFKAAGRDRQAGMSIKGSAIYSGGELEDLVSWIDATRSVEVVSHLPEQDVPRPASGWVWDFYSPKRLMEFEVEVYGRACEAYDEARAHSFSRLGWSMPSSALAPFGVALEVRFADASQCGGFPSPRLTMMRVPMELMTAIAAAESGAVWSVSRRAVITRPTRDQELDHDRHLAVDETIRSWLAQKNGGPAGGLGLTSTGADDMSKVRPASNVAAQWLWNDLKFLGLGSGTFPQLK